jgi:hypothetical protein
MRCLETVDGVGGLGDDLLQTMKARLDVGEGGRTLSWGGG